MALQWFRAQDMVVSIHWFPRKEIKRESGETPELPRSGKQVRKPKMTLEPHGSGKSGE
jgi:hypothetical protein